MLENPINVDILFIFALLSIWALLLYNVFLMIQGYRYGKYLERRIPQLLASSSESPKVSILIPAHNEEVVIERTVNTLSALDYPQDKLELLVINDGSTDRTGEIAEALAVKNSRITVITTPPETAGRGKSAALNYGIKFASGDVIGVYDADNTPERYVLRYLMAVLLSDKRLGAVVGKVRTRNRFKTVLTRFINIEFIVFQWMTQAGGWLTHNVTIIPGTNFFVWKHVLEEVGGWDEKAIAEDTELTIRLYKKGYYIQFVPDAITWEQEPEKWRIWFKQRTRWARGNEYVIFKFLGEALMLRNRATVSIVLYMFLTYGFFWVAIILSDFILIGGLLGIIELSIQGPFLFLWVTAYILFIVEIMVTLTLERNENTFVNFLLACLMYFTYCQAWIVLILVATLDWVIHPGTYWAKTERTEEEQPVIK